MNKIFLLYLFCLLPIFTAEVKKTEKKLSKTDSDFFAFKKVFVDCVEIYKSKDDNEIFEAITELIKRCPVLLLRNHKFTLIAHEMSLLDYLCNYKNEQLLLLEFFLKNGAAEQLKDQSLPINFSLKNSYKIALLLLFYGADFNQKQELENLYNYAVEQRFKFKTFFKFKFLYLNWPKYGQFYRNYLINFREKDKNFAQLPFSQIIDIVDLTFEEFVKIHSLYDE